MQNYNVRLIGIVLAFVLANFNGRAAAEHPIEVIGKTLSWNDGLLGYEVELTLHKYKQSIVTGKLAEFLPPQNSNDGIYSESIKKLHELKRGDGRFAIVSVLGISTIKTHNGNTMPNDVGMSHAIVGDGNAASVVDWSNAKVREGQLLCGKKSKPCDVVAREFAWSKLPLYFSPVFYQAGQEQEEVLDDTVALIADLGENEVFTEKVKFNKRAAIVYRLNIGAIDKENTGKLEGRRVLRIVVSDEGFDKGLVLEVKRLYLDPDVSKSEMYRNEEHVSHDVESFVTIEWKEIEAGSEKRVVPVHWISEDRKGPYSKTKLAMTAKWQLSEPQQKLMELDSLKSLCEKYEREVDRGLGR